MRQHAEAFTASGAGVITAVADVDPATLAALAELNPGARAYALADELLAGADVEPVVVALPTYLHRPVAIAALDAGKHVLCEKPPAVNAEEVAAMMDAARRRGRVLAFAAEVRKEAAPLTPPDDALAIMRLIDGLYRSAREGREIPIAPPGDSPTR